jgi:hypothetical protein
MHGVTDMLQRLLRRPRGVQVGVAITIGWVVPLALAAAVLVGAGLTAWLCASSTRVRLAGQKLCRRKSCHYVDAS